MAFGDTGVGGGPNKTPFQFDVPWTIGRVKGVDAGGTAKTVEPKMLIDSGAGAPALTAAVVTGFKATFIGVTQISGHGTKAALAVLAGPKISVLATDINANVDYQGIFAVLTDPTLVPIIGGLFWKKAGTYMVDVKGKKVKITNPPPAP